MSFPDVELPCSQVSERPTQWSVAVGDPSGPAPPVSVWPFLAERAFVVPPAGIGAAVAAMGVPLRAAGITAGAAIDFVVLGRGRGTGLDVILAGVVLLMRRSAAAGDPATPGVVYASRPTAGAS